ncbi:hypothetical protein ACN22W_34325 [Burkholderia theae]|uniref:hypothetical protein n=1 Tax=Burkholderia theae TaxID=3143496 RepID=UPI003AFA9BE6
MVQITEFRRLQDGGRRYLDDTCSIQELNGLASQCLEACKFWHGHPELIRATQEWIAMIDRRWNESRHLMDAVDENTFRDWLRDQLVNVEH